ncbi:hypothetical protein KEU06_09405 [Pseudaminobacter sp. 19-2017]|uniref:Uncharacterized protein n=1 Tax=Pseudaminobacter soli (ex Zhang et al. 2022) TaxID=2831468 RepID=A0A942E0L9_9HYPH|nr:hypothetical protein [Pseudaminobacter soli]MBS3648821.1 hypothetical protein [Pseudaminobacter soli]
MERIKLPNGWSAEIHQDEDCERPYQDDDAVRIVVLHGRYIDPAKGNCGSDPDEVARWVKENARDWFVTNLYLYDHSGVAYRAGERNPFSCPWDSGQVGIVALKKSEWGRGKGERNAKRLEYAKSVAEEYGRWANGECYGYVLHDPEGEESDSCWGHIGYDWVCEAAKDAAEAGEKARQRRLKEEQEERRLARQSRTKAYIRNHVPLDRRV